MNMLQLLLNFKALAYPVGVNFVEKRNATQLSSAWVFSQSKSTETKDLAPHFFGGKADIFDHSGI